MGALDPELPQDKSLPLRASSEDLTGYLNQIGCEDSDSASKLMPYIHGELRSIAASQLRRERDGHTLQATALVNEAFLRLFKPERVTWNDRQHFYVLAAKAMRRLLVDHARKRKRIKRGSGKAVQTLDEAFVAGGEFRFDLLDLNQALEELQDSNPLQSSVVELRYFGGLEIAEVATVLKTSKRTVERQWRAARAWLGHRLEAGS